ncbi:MAG: hypothetical protein NTX91_00170 [candidate division SR1 bacterium]|nr:hypothetical protein [candidate division SR1 bacterium]
MENTVPHVPILLLCIGVIVVAVFLIPYLIRKSKRIAEQQRTAITTFLAEEKGEKTEIPAIAEKFSAFDSRSFLEVAKVIENPDHKTICENIALAIEAKRARELTALATQPQLSSDPQFDTLNEGGKCEICIADIKKILQNVYL